MVLKHEENSRVKISRNLVLKVKAQAALAELEERIGFAQPKVKTQGCEACPRLNQNVLGVEILSAVVIRSETFVSCWQWQ